MVILTPLGIVYSFYAEDEMENTFISIFTSSNDELVIYVGYLQPKVWVIKLVIKLLIERKRND